MPQKPPVPDDWQTVLPPGFTPQYYPAMNVAIPQPAADVLPTFQQAMAQPQSVYPPQQPGYPSAISKQPTGY